MLDWQKISVNELYKDLINNLKYIENKYKIFFTHKQSINIELNQYLINLINETQNINLFVGKPFAFYTFIFLFSKKNNLDFIKIILDLNQKFQFNSVITQESYNYLRNIYNLPKSFIDPTLGSALSLVLGASFIKKKNKNIVIIPDSYLLFGEFWENLNFIKNFPEKINSEIEILFDFNNKNKKSNLKYTIFDIYNIQDRFLNHRNIKFKIFDNRKKSNIKNIIK